MGSAAKFFQSKLFGRSPRSEQDGMFVPRTAIAARIVGRSIDDPMPAGERQADHPAAFDSFTPGPAFPASSEPVDDTALERQSDRFLPTRTSTTVTDLRGKAQRARIINISATGVAIEADFRLMPPETITMVGSKPVSAGRSIRGGHVFVFDKPLDPARCNPQVLL